MTEISVDYKSNISDLPADSKISQNSDVTLGEIRENLNGIKSKFKSVHVQWDDVIQATTLGAVMLLRPEIVTDEDFEEEYLGREVSPMEFFNTKYGIPPEEIAKCLEENYEQILKISPLMENMRNFFIWAPIWENVHIFFKHPFDSTRLFDDIQNTLDRKVNIYIHTTEMNPRTIGEKPDMIFVRSAEPFYLYYTLEKKVSEVVYMTSLMNSGFTIEFMGAYMRSAETNQLKRPIGPELSQIFFYGEKFYAS